MRLDEIQAMLCAVVSAPEPVAPAIWLTEALGKGLEAGGNPEVEAALELLIRLNNDLAAALLADETISPVLYPLDESCQEYDYETWADSYVFGAGLAGDWYEMAGKHADDLSELLEPLFMLLKRHGWLPIFRKTCRSSCRRCTTSGATSVKAAPSSAKATRPLAMILAPVAAVKNSNCVAAARKNSIEQGFRWR